MKLDINHNYYKASVTSRELGYYSQCSD